MCACTPRVAAWHLLSASWLTPMLRHVAANHVGLIDTNVASRGSASLVFFFTQASGVPSFCYTDIQPFTPAFPVHGTIWSTVWGRCFGNTTIQIQIISGLKPAFILSTSKIKGSIRQPTVGRSISRTSLLHRCQHPAVMQRSNPCMDPLGTHPKREPWKHLLKMPSKPAIMGLVKCIQLPSALRNMVQASTAAGQCHRLQKRQAQ